MFRRKDKGASKFYDNPEKSLQIHISGTCGSGKSALINALLGDHIVPERKGVYNVSRSKDILAFNNKRRMQVPVRVWLSTQLQHQDFEKEEQYLKDLKIKCKDVDLIIYCIKMTETRFTPGNPDEVAIGKLFKALGPDSLKKAVFAMTFANNVASNLDKEHYKINTMQWQEIIKNTLEKLFRIRSQVEVIPVGYYKEMDLPTCKNWLESIWCKSLELMTEKAQQKMAANNENRFMLHTVEKKVSAPNPGSTPLVFSNPEMLDKFREMAKKIEQSAATI